MSLTLQVESLGIGPWRVCRGSRKSRKRLAAAMFGALIVTGIAMVRDSYAAIGVWDPSLINPPQDGSGTWDTSTTHDWSVAGGTTTWSALGTNATALFGAGIGTAGTVNLNTAITAGGLTFNAPGSGNYTITGSALTLAGTPIINIASGVAPTISDTLAGSSGVTISGAGTVNFAGINTYSGLTSVSSGTLKVASPVGLGSSSLLVASGASFIANSSLTVNNNVSNFGAFNVATGQTFSMPSASYYFNQTGGVLNISGTLAMTQMNFSGGVVNGTVLFNNSYGAITLGANVNSGNFLFTGTAQPYLYTSAAGIPAGVNVTIAPNGFSSSPYSASGSLVNAGTLSMISSPGYQVGLSSGTIFTNSGLFAVSATGTQVGYNNVSGPVLNTNIGIFNINANTSVNGAMNNAGTVNIAAGATLAVGNSQTFNQTGGTININGSLLTTGFNYSSGTVNGTVQLNSPNGSLILGTGISTGAFVYTGGNLSSLTTNSSTGIPTGISVTLQPAAGLGGTLSTGTNPLTNYGTVSLISADSQSVQLTAGTLFTNNGQFSIIPGGAQNASGDSLNSMVLNNGIFNLNANTSTYSAVNNAGTFNIASGQTFSVNSGQPFNQTNGTLNINGTLLTSAFNDSGGVINGTVQLNSSNSSLILGTGISTGKFLYVGGGAANLTTNSSTGIPTGITVTVQPNAGLSSVLSTGTNPLINNGTLSLISSAAQTIGISAGTLFTNNGQFSITPGGAQNSSGDSLNSTVFNNGIFNLNANTSTYSAVNNAGTFNIASGQTFSVNSGQPFNQTNGTLNINGTLLTSAFNDSGGVINGTVQLNSSNSSLILGTGISTGKFLYVGGGAANLTTVSSTGIPTGISVTVQPNAGLSSALSTGTNPLINNGTLSLISSANQTIGISAGTLFTNNGQFSITPGGAQNASGDSLNSTVFNNGIFNLNANTSTYSAVNNAGTFNIASGQTFSVNSGQPFNQTNGTLNINGALLTGVFNDSGGVINGTVQLNSSNSSLILGTGISTGKFLYVGGGAANLTTVSSTGIPTGISVTVQPNAGLSSALSTGTNPLINNGTLSLISAPNQTVGLSAGTLFTNNGQFSINASGAQNASNNSLNSTVLNNGTFNLNANTSTYSMVSNTGTFNISGSQNLIFNSSSAGFNQSLGTLNVGNNYYVGGTPTAANGFGFLNVSGGTVTVPNTLKIWNAQTPAQLIFSRGSIVTGLLDTSGVPANFNWTGGSLSITASNPSIESASTSTFGSTLSIGGSMNLSVGGGNNELLGVTTTGTILQNAGSNNVAASLNFGVNTTGSGFYVLSGNGALQVDATENIGFAGQGNFNQTGGFNYVSTLVVGTQSTATGIYTLAAGASLAVSTGAYIGQTGNGTFNQTGGSQTLAELGLGTVSGGVGTMNLMAGTTTVNGSAGVGGSPTAAAGSGVLNVTGTASVSVAGILTVYDSPANALAVGGTGNLVVSGLTLMGGSSNITGGYLTVYQTGLTFAGNDSPSLTINGGELYLNGDVLFNGSGGTGNIFSNGSGKLDLGGVARTFNIYQSSAIISMAIAANLTDGSVIKTGPGTLLLSGVNTFTGSVNVSGGTLELGNPMAINQASGTLVASVATLDLNGQTIGADPLVLNGLGVGSLGTLINSSANSASFAGPITLNNTDALGGYGAMNLSGFVTGSGGLTKVGFNTVTLSGGGNFSGGVAVTSGTLAITAPTSFTGGISLTGGTLAVVADNDLGDPGNSITLSTNGTFEAQANFSSSRLFNAAGGTLSVDPGQILTLSGSLTGNGPLSKAGGGTVSLTSSSSVSGAINISAGTLSLAGPGGALPNVTGINVYTGGILELNSITGNQTSNDRVADSAPITLAGGALSMQGSSIATTTETLGPLTLQAGASTIAVNSGAGQNASVTFTSLASRALGGTLSFNSSSPGGTGQLFINGLANGAHLGGWATVNGTDFAKYNTSSGVVPFTAGDYTYNSFAGGSDVQLTSAWSGTPISSISLSTLNFNIGSGVLLVPQTFSSTMTLNSGIAGNMSGGILKQGGGTANISGGIITSPTELDVLVGAGTLAISSTLSGPFVLTERGGGTLLLDGTTSNSYSGFTLVSGNLQLNASGGSAINGTFIVDGGSVLSLAGGQFSQNSNVILNSGNWNLNHQIESITSFTNNNGLMQFSGGTLTTTNGFTLNGGTTIIASNLSSNVITVSGGDNEVHSGGTVTDGSLSLLGSSPAVQIASDNSVPGKLTITGSGGLSFYGTGTATLASTGNFSQAGILDLNGNNGHTISVGNGSTFVISTQITNGGFNFAGPGTLELLASNTYNGGTTITGTGSTLIAANLSALGASTSPVTFAGGNLDLRSDAAPATAAYNYSLQIATAGTSTNIDIDWYTPSSKTAGTFSLTSMNIGSGSAAFNVSGSDGGTLIIGSTGLGATLSSAGGTANINVLTKTVNLVINGPLTQVGAVQVDINKDKPGTLTFMGAGANVYGNTTVSAGMLVLNKSSGIAIPNNLSINGGSTVQLQQSNQINPASVITINGTNAISELDLNGNNNTFTGGISFVGGGNISSGTGTVNLASDVVVGAAASPALVMGNLNLSGGARTFNVSRGTATADMQISAAITGNAGLTKIGNGILYLSGANTFTGPIQIGNGVLEVNSLANLGNSANQVTLSGGTLQFYSAFDPAANGSLALNASSNLDTLGNTVPIAEAISGVGSLTKLGTGTLQLKGNNSYAGLTIAAGTVQASTDSALGTAGTQLTFAGGTLMLSASVSTNRPILLNSSGGTLNASTGMVTLSNALTWNGNLSLAAGTLNFSQTSGTTAVSNTAVPTLTIMPTATVIDGGTVDPLRAIGGSLVNVVNNSVTSFDVTAGAKYAGAISGIGNTNISSGASLTATYIRQTNLFAYGNVNIAAQTGAHNASTTVSVVSLTLPGTTNAWTSRLDLANNDLIDAGGSLAIMTNQIGEGFGTGGWTGSGGIISSSSAGDSTHLTTLGIMQNNQSGTALYGSGTAHPLFDGQSPNPSDILVKYTLYGDANLSGKVDGSDYSLIDSGFLTHATGWFNGDFNYDGVIDGSDYTLIDNAFNSQSTNYAAAIAQPTASIAAQIAGVADAFAAPGRAVPEPSAIGTILFGATTLLGRRRRR